MIVVELIPISDTRFFSRLPNNHNSFLLLITKKYAQTTSF